jgi:hypothetical protein
MHDHEDHERALSGWLRAVADADAAETAGASAAVRERLLAEVGARARARRAARVKMYALAAGLAMATTASVWHVATRSASVAPDRRSTTTSHDAEVATAFYPLAYGTVPVTHGSIVRLEVSPSAFTALGVEPLNRSASPSDVVLADVLVGEDGLARAVRFVRTAREARGHAARDAQEPRP